MILQPSSQLTFPPGGVRVGEGRAGGGLIVVNPEVTIIKTSATAMRVYLPVPGDTSGDERVRTSLIKTTSPNLGWCINDLAVYAYPGETLIQAIVAANSALEFAYTIGAEADAEADYDFYSNSYVHGSVVLQSAVIHVDGVETTLVTETPITGTLITLTQIMDIIYPKDNSTVIGSVTLIHSFNGATGVLTVSHAHSYVAGYNLYRAYSAMLPTANANITHVSVGDAPLYATGVMDDSAHFQTQSNNSYGLSAAHSYRPRLMLPSGGPDVNGSWLKAAPENFWWQDRIGNMGKFYVNWISSTFANRVPAVASSHASQYRITKIVPSSGLSPSKSTFIDSGATNTNYGVNLFIDVGEYKSAARIWRGLLAFDLSGIAPTATVTSAKLYLTLAKVGSTFATNAGTMKAHRVLHAWVEGDKNGVDDTPASGATQIRYDAANNWGTAGCGNTTTDREVAEMGSVAMYPADVAFAEIEMVLDVALVQAWVDGSFANNGILLKMETETDDAYQFFSRHVGNAMFAPRLVIVHTP